VVGEKWSDDESGEGEDVLKAHKFKGRGVTSKLTKALQAQGGGVRQTRREEDLEDAQGKRRGRKRRKPLAERQGRRLPCLNQEV